MPEVVALLPTTRDEDWRYADAEFLASVTSPTVLTHWTKWEVAPGETLSKHITLISGETVLGDVRRTRVHVGSGGRFEAFVTIAGGKYMRFELEVTLEEGAHFEFGGVTLGGGDKRQEFVTRVIHAHPNVTSNQVVRAVHWGHATGSFLGRIEVARDAQKTDAAQSFKAILLEKGASANAKPELEIFADDVKCAHGAAIGALDQQAAFYLASRGLPPESAKKLLVRAFVADAFVAIQDDQARELMLDRALYELDEGAL